MLLVTVIVVSVVALIWIKRADDSYGPINSGGFAGPGVQSHIVSDGEHTVKITGIDTDDVTIRAQWATANRLIEQEIEQAIRLYAQGWSLVRIGDWLGRDHSSVWNVLKRAGIPRRDSHGRPVTAAH